MDKETHMKRKITLLSSALASILAALALVSTAAADGVARSATGSGQFEFTSDAAVSGLRTFAFEAHVSSDGTARGQAEVKNRAVEQRFHI
jgi:hypothetical protein